MAPSDDQSPRSRRREVESGQGDGFACRIHKRLVATCADCRRAWTLLAPEVRESYRHYLWEAVDTQPRPELPSRRVLSSAPEAVAQLRSQTEELRKVRRRAKKELSKLRRTPRGRRVDRVRNARTQFRTRPVAELLIEEAREVVREDPKEAESFAGLVPHVLDWVRSPGGPAWAFNLCARADAHRANALRVQGELPGADRVFEILRQTLMRRPIADAATAGELASLEASLRIDQRRFEAAKALLDRALAAFEHAGDGLATARVLIKAANLERRSHRPLEMLRHLDRAADALNRKAPPYLWVCIVTGQVNALCDLGRYGVAKRVIGSHLDAFEADPSPHTAALLRGLHGRVCLGLGDLGDAERFFQTSADVLLSLDRTYDAAMAALYLAETYHLIGQIEKLRHLAQKLVPVFRDRGVTGEALEALRLVHQAVAAQELTRQLLETARRRLERAALA